MRTRPAGHPPGRTSSTIPASLPALVRAWPNTNGAPARPTFADAAARRAAVVEAVRRLTVP
ncbi:hypothetical protein [Actinoallomurus acanthiterrae]